MTRRRNGVDLIDSRHMTVARRDFASRDGCDFCHHPLPSGTATILVTATGEERQAGPECARALGKAGAALVPDLTRGALSPHAGGRPSRRWLIAPTIDFDVARIDAAERQADIEYLLLRAEKLPRLGFARPPVALAEALTAYRADPSAAPLGEVRRVRERNEHLDRRDSLENLGRCYAAAVWIDRCRESGKVTTGEARWLRETRHDLVGRQSLPAQAVQRLNGVVSRVIASGPVLKEQGLVLPEIQHGLRFGAGELTLG